MKTLKPPVVYVCDKVLENRLAKKRMDRLMTKIETPEVKIITDQEFDELIRENGWSGSRRLSGRQRHGDPPIVLNVYRWLPEDFDRTQPVPREYKNMLSGLWNHRTRENILKKDGVVCQSGYGFHSARGCLFKCDYCFFEDLLLLELNMEEFLEHLDPFVRSVEGPTLWKWDNQSDTICFEPEMGATKIFVEYFSQFDNHFLMLYTKSDNVDFLLDLDHKGQTLVCWTLNAYTQSRMIERDAATMEERIEAARKCQEAGYPVRFRLSAVCPVKGWQRENREMLELLFKNVRPDLISLETLSRMPSYQMFENVMDAALFEPRFVEAIKAGREEMKGKIWGPIPDNEREEIYRFLINEIHRISPKTSVSLCQEPAEMWQRLSDVLTVTPDYYVCCCAKDSVPGHALIPEH
ncbi:spore photoproduct lyase family protein [Candidatus Poribacteria bacterium]